MKSKKKKIILLVFIIISIFICRYNFEKVLNISLEEVSLSKSDHMDKKCNSLDFHFSIENTLQASNIYSIYTTFDYPKELEPYILATPPTDLLCDKLDDIKAGKKEKLTRHIYLKTDNFTDEELLDLAKKVSFKFNYISYGGLIIDIGFHKQYLDSVN